jgi:hypothetical protein
MAMAEEKEQISPKWGAGHLQAWLRAGAKEISQVLPAFPESVRPVEEPGLAGNLTPQEVLSDKQRFENILDGYASRGSVHGPEKDRGMER